MSNVLQVRRMAGAVLKALARWIEAQVGTGHKTNSFVTEALDAVLLDGANPTRQPAARMDQHEGSPPASSSCMRALCCVIAISLE